MESEFSDEGIQPSVGLLPISKEKYLDLRVLKGLCTSPSAGHYFESLPHTYLALA